MNNPLVTVIIPVYKVESYLRKCVDSVLNQTYKNLEVILVDDGSPDSCPAICDEYAANDNRVRVIHKENGGLSDARNAGIKGSTGAWLLYVDSDDYIEVDSIKRLLSCVTEPEIDIVVGVAKEIKLDGRISFQRHSNLKGGEVLSAIEYICKSIKESEWFAPAWLNLYKADFIKKNNLFFIKGLLYEDLEILPRTFLSAGTISYCNFPFYNYRLRENSIMTNSKLEQSQRSAKYILSEWIKIFKSISERNLQKTLFQWYVRIYLFLIGKYKIQERFYPEKTNILFFLRYSRNIKMFVKVLLLGASKELYTKIYSLTEKK